MANFTIPTFQLPPSVARLGEKLPQWPHALNLTLALNTALKIGWLPVDELDELEGKIFRVIVRDTGGIAHFTYSRRLFRPIFQTPDTVDLNFSANLSAYLQLISRQEDPDTLFFNRQLEITGDTELGLRVKNLLDTLEIPPVVWLQNKLGAKPF